MPLFKGVASKAKPKKGIDYITRPDKAAIVSNLSLDNSRDYARQFRETCELFGKGNRRNERKYYHFKLSPDPTDCPSPQQVHKLAEQIAKKLFSSHECVIATHTDSGTIHSHIIVNAVSFETGKKLRMWKDDYAISKDLADKFGENFGFTALEWRGKTEIKRRRILSGEALSSDDKYLNGTENSIAKRDKKESGTASWKEALRQAIDEAKVHCRNRREFRQYLKDIFDIDMPRNTARTVSFVHPAVGRTYAVRGAKLGAKYTAENIDRELHLNKINKERSEENIRLFTAEKARTRGSIDGNQPPSQAGNGECVTSGGIGNIGAELRKIDAAVQSVIGGDEQKVLIPNQRNAGDADACTEQRQAASGAVEDIRDPKPVIHPKTKQNSWSHER